MISDLSLYLKSPVIPRRSRPANQSPACAPPTPPPLLSLLSGLLSAPNVLSQTDAPITTSVLWANLSGSLARGFLLEDRLFFVSTEQPQTSAQQQNHKAHKRTIALYIGLTTGFSGSLTSFSSFIRDAFLALTNARPTTLPPKNIPPRNGGDSFRATLAWTRGFVEPVCS
ncbi:hypothetical protein BO82DRAFT_428951 [Aspergillus uvarum CBS 121591]|uniref:Uncharacterized protein n=1 Tax=Aspergillus uvarum CBS 121591 TaxID=1448315 RepID=A0A319CN15_9EURO|nr:hypothetical protein BO82DRAFT_428951 [Aspergillus uvarum CBS 121591]PYH85980.1 hypothetical protein BO82DRAFT_428951 [Aspergillus uvarum CBS 121591]